MWDYMQASWFTGILQSQLQQHQSSESGPMLVNGHVGHNQYLWNKAEVPKEIKHIAPTPVIFKFT